jgi:uncharacterized membrane protein
MAEIGSRALSPATNDPGTAIDVIGRLTRLLSRWAEGRQDVPVDFPRLQKSLAALQRQGSPAFRQAAAAQSALALERSEPALSCETDRQRLRELVAETAHSLQRPGS